MWNAEVFCPPTCFGGDFSISSWFLHPATSVILLLTILNFTSSQSVKLLLQRVWMHCRALSSLRRDGLVYLILRCHSLLLTSIIIGKISLSTFTSILAWSSLETTYIWFSLTAHLHLHLIPRIHCLHLFCVYLSFGLTSHLYLHPISIYLGFTSNLDLNPI